MYARQRPKKTLNEIYGAKADINVQSAQQKKNNNARVQREYTAPAFMNTFQALEGQKANAEAGNATYRRNTTTMRTKRGAEMRNRNVKANDKDNSLGNVINADKENSKFQTTRIDKNQSYLANAYENSQYFDTFENFVKAQTASAQLVHQQQHQQQQQQQQQLHHQQQHPTHQHHQHCQHQREKRAGFDEDRDEDTEEFIALIQQTVENAIGKSISDLLNRNFRDISAKIDNFAEELKATQKLLMKFQTDMTKKVVHYGEENARHFRYLCMKSEYDKMFYQHQSLVSNTNANKMQFPPIPAMPSVPAMPATMPTVPQLAQMAQMLQVPTMVQMQQAPPETYRAGDMPINNEGACGDNNHTPCTCRGSKSGVNVQAPNYNQYGTMHKSLSSDNQRKTANNNGSSGDVGMREVIDQLQRFCVQFQANDGAAAGGSGNPINNCTNAGNNTASKQNVGNYSRQNTYRPEDAIMVNKQAFLEEDDDEDDCMSTDGMSVNSLDQMQKYEAKAKIMTSQRAKVSYAAAAAAAAAAGGGDAQY